MRTSVVVPVAGRAGGLRDLLTALAAQTEAPDEVVVVDNGAVPPLAERPELRPGNDRLATRLVQEPSPGSYRARNAGVAVAGGDLVLFTDVDCRPRRDWVAAHRRFHGGDCLRVAAGAVEVDPPATGGALARIVARYDRAMAFRQRWYVAEAGYGATANLSVPRAVLDAVGPFDDRLVSSGDRAWCHRATAAGTPVEYAPDAVVDHAPRTLAEWRRKQARIALGLGQLHGSGARCGSVGRVVVRPPVRQVWRACARPERAGVTRADFPVVFALHWYLLVAGHLDAARAAASPTVRDPSLT